MSAVMMDARLAKFGRRKMVNKVALVLSLASWPDMVPRKIAASRTDLVIGPA